MHSEDVELSVLCKSKRAQKERVLELDESDSQLIFFYLIVGNEKRSTITTPYVFQVEIDPKSHQELMSSGDGIFWKYAINNEINSLMSNNTWELVY